MQLKVLLLTLLCLSKCCFLHETAAQEQAGELAGWDAGQEEGEAEGEEDEDEAVANGHIRERSLGSADELVGLSTNANTNEFEPQTYGVIVDCGSSGTRAHIYQWDTELDYPELLQDIEPMRDRRTKEPVSRKFSPGLSSLADKTSAEVKQYIKQVADYVHDVVPRHRHAYTVVYILATAGMRLLDDESQQRIMHEIRDYVKANYNFLNVKSSVISGSNEGMYQWISVNAKAKRFLGKDTTLQTKTYGVIEMGGASVQVTYHLRRGVCGVVSSSMPEELKKTYLAQRVEPLMSRHKPGNSIILHSTTFLGFGSNSARELYLDLLIKKHYTKEYMKKFLDRTRHWFAAKFGLFGPKSTNSMLVIHDPCVPRDYTTRIIEKPKRMLDNKNQSIGFITDEDEPTFKLQVKGTGNYNKCRRNVKEMLMLAKEERLNCKPDEKHCTMTLVGEPFVPFQTGDFLGLGDIYYTTNTMLEMAGTYHHDQIVERTKDICNRSYQQLQRRYPEISSDPQLSDRLESECFKAVWVDTFLTKGLRMPHDYDMLQTVGEINNDKLDWTLGAVLDKSLSIDQETERSSQDIVDDEEEEEEATTGRSFNWI